MPLCIVIHVKLQLEKEKKKEKRKRNNEKRVWKKRSAVCFACPGSAPCPPYNQTFKQRYYEVHYTPYEFESGDSGTAVFEECREGGGSRCGLTRSSQAMEIWLQERKKPTHQSVRFGKSKIQNTYSDG